MLKTKLLSLLVLAQIIALGCSVRTQGVDSGTFGSESQQLGLAEFNGFSVPASVGAITGRLKHPGAGWSPDMTSLVIRIDAADSGWVATGVLSGLQFVPAMVTSDGLKVVDVPGAPALALSVFNRSSNATVYSGSAISASDIGALGSTYDMKISGTNQAVSGKPMEAIGVKIYDSRSGTNYEAFFLIPSFYADPRKYRDDPNKTNAPALVGIHPFAKELSLGTVLDFPGVILQRYQF